MNKNNRGSFDVSNLLGRYSLNLKSCIESVKGPKETQYDSPVKVVIFAHVDM